MRFNQIRFCVISLTGSVILVSFLGCNRESAGLAPSASKQIASAEDLATARKGFVTKLRVRGPAPQPYRDPQPPIGVQQVEYHSGDLTLKGWLSTPPDDGKRHPAVVFLHGGFAFAANDWTDASPFADAGFVLFMPMLRGENGNPGVYESFYGEVDDAIAAGRYVSSLPQVDKNNIFVAGHSSGAVLSCLTAMMPSPYKAAAAFDGYLDMQRWVKGSPPIATPYDPKSEEEIRLRNPLEFAASLQIPLTLYAGDRLTSLNEILATGAKEAGKSCEVVMVPGDHHAMVAPAVQKAIAWFQSQTRN